MRPTKDSQLVLINTSHVLYFLSRCLEYIIELLAPAFTKERNLSRQDTGTELIVEHLYLSTTGLKKDGGIYYPVYGIVHIKDPLLLIIILYGP